MKRILPLLLALMMMFCLTACGGSDSQKSDTTTMTVREMYDALAAAQPMDSPSELDEFMLNDLFYVDSAWTDSWVASMSQMNTSSDNLAVFHVTDGNAKNVAEAMQKRADDVASSFEQYMPEEGENAENALIITRGEYVFFAINADYDAIKTAIDGFFA